MAAAFLSQLLRVENSVEPNSSDRCIVCLTECGTLCDESGIVEWEMRLPCDHKVGSRCIATWLDPTGAANNSCPVCRYVFFPAQPRPYLEHGIIEEDHFDMSDGGEYDGPGSPNYNADNAWTFNPVNRDFGRLYYHGAEDDDDQGWGPDIGGGNIPGSPGYSPRSSDSAPRSPVSSNLEHQGNTMAEDDDDDDDEEVPEEDIHEGARVTSEVEYRPSTDLQTVKAMCETYSYRLNFTSSSKTIAVSQRFAEKIHVACALAGHAPPSVAAVAVFVASHLAGAPKTAHWVSLMSGVDADAIAGLYWFVCPARVRAELVDEEMLAMIDRGDRETVLGFLPGA
ncbi:hypothetical protein HO173_002819 [Letharia columbiana]|uniref:RING-type domain-containing protein n=1 Tax=Letharia columbiana TaxID=112416 RepID=A0A8H6G1T7_9LECA|nr:uncharacterized protein HO173_002819 [Letharia columbiana]KAF6238947.1 hypothetical protein HO173_002819 [Letharia columbiana]